MHEAIEINGELYFNNMSMSSINISCVLYSVDVPEVVTVTLEIIHLHVMLSVLCPPLVTAHLYVCLFQTLVAGRMILSCTFQFTTNITKIYATYLMSSVQAAVLMTVVPKTDICRNT
jgi:hypothetical protein